jgi:D-alanyl-D-alanine carboxypeptidase/D-alanyl-D-alanine-endopeptidase (penicillin-binding protein 4)
MGSTPARRVVASVLVVAAAALLALAFSGGETQAASVGNAATTPLWSVRRVPQPVVQAVGSQHLQAALDGTAPGDGTCFLVKVGASTLAAHNQASPLLGASTQKILVAAAALSALGPDTKFTTKVVAPSAPADGAVDRLWLVGSGDPVLATGDYVAFLQSEHHTRGDATTSLEALADAIVAKGIRRIPGGVAGDDSRYDEQRYLPTWKDTYRTDGEIGPMGALTVNGGFSAWSSSRKTVVADPALNAATLLTGLLRARGVTVGPPDHATAPHDTVDVAQVVSPDLRSIVAEMLGSSDNLTAELLTKELAVRAGYRPGTTAAGVAEIRAKLAGLGVTIDPVVKLEDGSGLSRNDRVTCGLLVDTLGLTARPEFGALFDGLAVAGQRGTLSDLFLGTPLAGALHAKTGGLDGVAGLTGVVVNGETVRFAFLDNGSFPVSHGAALFAPIAQLIDRFPDTPSVDALVPAPK